MNTTRDDANGPLPDGLVTLRDAVTLADRSLTPCTISFDPKVFGVPRGITLNGSALELSNTLQPTTITGSTAAPTVQNVYGSGAFVVDFGVNVHIKNINIANCQETAISNRGTLTFADGSVSDCTWRYGDSGGLDNFGTAVLTGDMFVRNAAAAVFNAGSLKVSNSTFYGNSSGAGGAINNDGTASLVNDTFSNNKGDTGGAIYNAGSASLFDVTISNNVGYGIGGGISNNRNDNKDATVTIANSIIAGNVLGRFDSTDADINGTVHSLGHNLVGQADGVVGLVSSDISGTAAHPLDPRLGPLGYYGGATKTMPSLGGSAAIGAGSVALLPAGVTADQRGDPRIVGGTLDIGAVQTSGPVTITLKAPPAQSCLRFKPTAIELGSIESVSGQLPAVVVVNWGDGSADSVLHVNELGTLSRLLHSFLNPGTMHVSLSATDASTHRSNLIAFSVTVGDAPAVVNSLTLKADTGSGLLGLGDAVDLVDQTETDATISFDPKVFAIHRAIQVGKVQLSGHHTVTVTGPTAGVTLNGAAQFDSGLAIAQGTIANISGLAISGCADSGISSSGELHLSNSVISGNMGEIGGGGITNYGTMFLTNVTISGNSSTDNGGGGIFNDYFATATLEDVRVLNNRATDFGDEVGGGIKSLGAMTIADSNISGNVGAGGGGIYNEGQLSLTDVNVSKNKSIHSGGGIFSEGGTVKLTNVNLSRNVALWGGGAINYGTMNFINVTIADNTASGFYEFEGLQDGSGGGLLNDGKVSFNNVTVAGNKAYLEGGGIQNIYFGDNSPAPFTMANSIVADNAVLKSNAVGPDVSGSIKSLGHNLIGQTDGSLGWTKADLLGTSAHPLDPMLAPLGFYGGFNETMPPLPGSPAVDHGSNQLIPQGIITDQRGLPRISHGTVDIGAVELQQPQIVGLFLVNARTGQTIMRLVDGAVIDLSKVPPELTVVAQVQDGVPGSIVYGLDATSRFRIETGAPYSLFGDFAGRYFGGTFTAGKHTIAVQAYTDAAAKQAVGKPLTIHFTVIDRTLVKEVL